MLALHSICINRALISELIFFPVAGINYASISIMSNFDGIIDIIVQ